MVLRVFQADHAGSIPVTRSDAEWDPHRSSGVPFCVRADRGGSREERRGEAKGHLALAARRPARTAAMTTTGAAAA